MIKLRRPYCLQNESILRFLQMLATASTLQCLETFDFRKKYRYRHAFTVCKVLGERDIFGKLLPHGCPKSHFHKKVESNKQFIVLNLCQFIPIDIKYLLHKFHNNLGTKS